MQQPAVLERLDGVFERRMVAIALLVPVACGPPAAAPDAPSQQRVRFSSSAWNVNGGGSEPGSPFDRPFLHVEIEVRNRGSSEAAPVCVIYYGSMIATLAGNDEPLAPGERRWVSGRATFPRPLDDYESGGVGCWDRLPRHVQAEIDESWAAMEPGREVQVPNLHNRPLDSSLPTFRRGLLLEIGRNATVCSERRLLKLAYMARGPFRSPCGAPRVVTQHPQPGASLEVGDEVTISVRRGRR